MKILVVDDCVEVRNMVKAGLSQHDVVEAANLQDAKVIAQQNRPDLILLDLTLPDGDGIDYCEEAVKDPVISETPVVIITSKTDISEKLAGFNAGADDYITKPFHLSELRARVDAVLRRVNKGDKTHKFRTKSFEIDLEQMKLYRREPGTDNNLRFIDLTPTELRIFLSLVKNAGRVLSRQDLVKAAWQEGFLIELRGIDSHVCHIRRKLGEDGNKIKAVYGKGYMFVAEENAAVSVAQKLNLLSLINSRFYGASDL